MQCRQERSIGLRDCVVNRVSETDASPGNPRRLTRLIDAADKLGGGANATVHQVRALGRRQIDTRQAHNDSWNIIDAVALGGGISRRKASGNCR
jgi:hypothetical protein